FSSMDLMHKMAIIPNWQSFCPHPRKYTSSRPHSSPGRVYSKNGFQNMLRPPSSTTTVANPILSFLDVKRILFQKITDKRDELKKAFQLLDTGQNLTVSKSELRRTIAAFLLPLTREQFQEVLAQVPVTGSGNVPYLEFLSRFAITKAFKLIDVNKTGLVQPQELKRLLETFCLKMTDEEYKRFSKHYNIDKDTAVDYHVFLKKLGVNNDLNLRYFMGNQEITRENQQAKLSRRAHLPSFMASDSIWDNCPLDDIERTFCREFSKSHEKVEKALSAGDPSKGGYVSLNYLKVVLDTFVYWLPRRIFLQLMKRFGFKTTSKINWKHFLASFNEPQEFEVSYMVSSKKSSSLSSRNQPQKENIVNKLFRHGEDSYMALKKALLIINTRNVKMTGEELRHILNCMIVNLSDSEFKELMQTLDPGGTGTVSISSFIDLLENPKTRRTLPCAESKMPLHLAWNSVEEMVHDAITRHLQAFYDTLQSYDLRDTGTISRSNFKKIMHTFCPFLTNEHLTKLSSKFQDTVSGRILYKKFLACVGIKDLPTMPIICVSKDKSSEHFQKEQQQPPDLSERTKPPEGTATETKNMTQEAVIGKLRTCVQGQDPMFRQRFLQVSQEPEGRIDLCGFRKVLEDSGMPMDDTQFSQLTTKIGFKKEGMSYLDFAAGFKGTEAKPGLQEATPPQTPAGFFFTAQECLKLFPRRLKEHFQDAYAAFFKMDTDMDGIISMYDLHKLLLQLRLNLKEREFERFLGLLGLRVTVTLNFREFQHLCEKRTPRTDDAPQRLIRTKQKVADSELACEQAHQYLVIKAKNRWADLSKNFIETDNEGNGILRRRDIKNALYGFDIPLTPREFEKLWQSYDTEGTGHITYQEFLQKLGLRYSPTVHRPYAEDYFNFLGHFTKPQQVQEEIQELHMLSFRDKLEDHYQDISKALTTLDKSKTGSVSLCKLRKVLRNTGCPAKSELQVNNHWYVSVQQDNSVNYLDFLRALEKSQLGSPRSRDPEGSLPINFSTLNPEEIVKNIQEAVESAQPALLQAFSALDKEDTGFVNATEFGQVLKDVCCQLSDNQYHYFLRKLRIHLVPYINWKYFLENFSSFLEETADEWAEKMPRIPTSSSPGDMANRDILERLHRAVASHPHTIAQELENFDTMKTNTVSRDEFRAVCTRHVQILTDKQFDRLWNEMPVNAKGRLKYPDFLSRFGSERAATPPVSDSSTRAQRGSSVPVVLERTRSTVSSPTHDLKVGSKSRSLPCVTPGTPPLQNCEPLESKLRKQVQGCWRGLLKECKEKDVDKQGTISASEFLALAEKFNLDMSKEESQQLVLKYDLKNNGRFAYCDFIQSCVLLLKAKETALMHRMRIQNTQKMKEAGTESCSLYMVLLRIQPKILHCWRPMRRSFKSYDEGGTGLLSVADFRKVLRQYSINLSEEEFFHVLEYDKTLSSRVAYNDFLRAFLQ
uniref:EF-hand calcium-binding domain-containing protein 6 n=1 Tax=Spermophilus dauricus TaxID=99837 RepID=A0A8C9PG84_SPEDA